MKKAIRIIINLIILILIATNVQANTKVQANLETQKSEIKKGEELLITLKFSDYEDINKGINAYKAILEYDKNIFEEVLQSDFDTQNNWRNLKYNKDTGEFVSINKSGSRNLEEVAKIKLKVKENTILGKSDVIIKDIVTSEGREDISVGKVKSTINIIGEHIINPDDPNQPNNPNDSNGMENGYNNGENLAPGKLPNTGMKYQRWLILIAIEILIIIAFVNRKKGKHIDKEINKKTKMFMTVFITGLVTIQLAGTIYAAFYDFSSKGELNNDGEINYLDVDLLELHLIHQKELPEEKLENADINSDKKITVTDLTLLVQKLEKTLEYKVILTNANENNYYRNKNEEIILTFLGEVNYDEKIRTVTINYKEYEVENSKEKNIYKVNVGAVEDAGVKEYSFSEVTLENGKKIKVNYTIKLDILKSIPSIENYSVEENINESKVDLVFDIKDIDNSITSAQIEVLNEKYEIEKKEDIKTGRNNVEVPVEDGKKYKVKLIIHYDLDTNELTENKEEHTGLVEEVKELEFIIDYKFKISNIETYKENIKTNQFEKNEPIKIKFNSSNQTRFEPERIRVNGKEYLIEKDNNYYLVTIDPINEVGEKNIKLEKIKLSNGKKFELENKEVNVKILKQKPTVTDFKVGEDLENKKIIANFVLKDEDNSIESASIILLDSQGLEIERKKINKGNVEIKLNTKITSKYTVRIIATYNQSTEHNIVDATLLEQQIIAKPYAEIKNVQYDKEYIEKGKNINITYEITTNKTEEIAKVLVNSIECTVTKTSRGKYTITYPVGSDSGIKEITATKVIYKDNTSASVNNTIKIEILKDKPVIKEFRQKDNLNKSEVSLEFNINDQDKAFIEGKAILEKEGHNTIQEREIHIGENSATFTVEEDKAYKLYINATYDLDTNSLENKPIEDNKVIDDLLGTYPVELISDYKLTINDLKTYNENTETKYFNKDETIKIGFKSTNVSDFSPKKVIINQEEYEVSKKQNEYQTMLKGYKDSGVKDIVIEKVILDNGKELKVTENNQARIEILKDKPIIIGFNYEESDNNEIKAKFNLVDKEETRISGVINILDENKKVIVTKEMVPNENIIIFKKTSSEEYTIKAFVNYDLDTNALETGLNEYQNQILLNQHITTSDRLLEMKDIRNVSLYGQTQNGIEEITSIKTEELQNLEKYLVKVEMKDLPSFYSEIKKYKIENDILKLTLDYDEKIIQYNGEQKHNYLEVEYGKLKGDAIVQNNLDRLIQLINENPSGNYELNIDIDAGKITTGEAVILQEFSGTLDFNGHTIRNLSRPLFKSLNGAKIENLVIENAVMTAYGAITPNMTGTTLRNIHITNSTISSPGINGTGSLAGNVSQKSLIENCSATNIKIGNQKRTGGIVGKMYDSTIRNCYVTGRVSSTVDGSAGLVGETPDKCIIENSYVKVDTDFSWTTGSIAGISGYSQNVIMINNLSLAKSVSGDEHGNRVFGNSISNSSKNNYELETSNLRSNAQHKAVNTVDEAKTKTKEFYINKLKWNEKIWNFDNLDKIGYPTLRNSDPNNIQEERPSNSKIYIPDYERLKKLKEFDSNKEIAYYNMYRLMPYYDAKFYVEDGNKIEENHVLNNKVIKQVLPFDKNGKMIVGLAQNEKDKIKTVKILFDDDNAIAYNVVYKNSFTTVANYEISELGIGYNYNKYLIDTNSEAYKELVKKVECLDYIKDISEVTQEKETRNYIENYPKVQKKAKEFGVKLFSNNEDYMVSFNSKVLNDKINQQLAKDKMLEKILYSYNYFDRFYGIEIGGINITDIVFFDGSIFNKNLNSITMTNTLVDIVPQNERLTQNLPKFYNNRIRQYTGKTLGLFLEYFIQNLTEEKYKKEPESWIVDNYWGTIYENVSDNLKGKVRYHVWDHMKAREELILSILTYKGTDMYLLGLPTTIMVGNIKTYFGNGYPTATKEQKIQKLISFSNNAGTFYNTIGSIVKPEILEVMNRKTHISYDSTRNKNWSQDPNAEPIYKAFYEVINIWPVHNGASAFANGNDMFWLYDALNFYAIFTHENVHNQDGYLFMEGTGRRRGLGMEMYTDGFLTQGFGEIGVIPNYSFEYKITDNISTNLTTDRINSRQKINDYYSKMFDLYTTLEYLEGKAFLELTPEEQSKLALVVEEQIIFPGQPNRFLRATNVSKTKEDFERMKLKTINDLWDNKIITARTPGRRDMGSTTFTGSSMWYIPNYDDGATETTFKTIAYQILGEFGYDGYVAYAGGKYQSDLEVIRVLTGNDKMTWKQYQMERYSEAERKLKDIAYFDSNEIIKQMKNAMRKDIENGVPSSATNSEVILRKIIYGYIKRATNDFRSSIYDPKPNIIHINTAEQFVEKMRGISNGNIVIEKDLDFTNIKVDTSTIMNIKFTGTIDGKNNKIIGLNKPLYESIIYSNIKDLNIENSNIDLGQTEKVGALSKNIELSNIENVNLTNVSIKGKGIVGGIAGYANQVNVKNSIAKVTVLSTENNAGGLFGQIDYSTIQNVHITESTIKGSGKVGGILGYSKYMYDLKESTANVNITATGNEVGGIAGEINNGNLSNCYSLGIINTANNNVGGLVGWVTSSKINNSYTNMDISGKGTNGTGGFVGLVDQNHNTNLTQIKNNIAFGRVREGGYKFDGRTQKNKIESDFNNNYEYKEARGISTLERNEIDFNKRIDLATTNDISNPQFYIQTLGWDTNIWDFSQVSKGGLPKLNNLDPNNITEIIKKVKINTIEDFLRINEKPDDMYILGQDLNFDGYNSQAEEIITAVFSGVIEGNGHTISNFRNTLFKSINGAKIENLKIKNSEILNNKSKGILANEIKNTMLTKIYFNDITIENSGNMVGGIAGLIKSSILKQISLINIKIKANNTIGGVAGQVGNSTLQDILVEGNLEGMEQNNYLGARIGGITGWHELASNNIINRVISKVDIKATKISGNGGIIGGPDRGNINMQNTISLSTGKNAYRIAGFSSVLGNVKNVYEFELSNSETNRNDINKNNVKIATKENIVDKKFYKDTLIFDDRIWNLDTVSNLGYPTLR